jgi:hypothetical protein
MKIGYSCWGFLGNGIVDTPDGGRSHRMTLISELIREGNSVIMLQKNRDLEEAGDNIVVEGLTFGKETPDIDALFIEYRWPIQGRNINVSKDSSAYTPDLDRQNELISTYLNKVPILIWDKDEKLTDEEFNLFTKNNLIKVLEPSLEPNKERTTLLFPNNGDSTLKAIEKLETYTKDRQNTLVYIGNRYERDKSFNKYINMTAQVLGTKAVVYGKWLETDANLANVYEHVDFKGRAWYKDVPSIYSESFATVIIAPDRYYERKQYTQRLFECLWELCIPFVPAEYECTFLPSYLNVNSGKEVAKKIMELKQGTNSYIQKLLKESLNSLDIFSVEKQVNVILNAIKELGNK